MQEIHRKRSSMSRWSGWAVISGLLVHGAAARQRSGLSRPAASSVHRPLVHAGPVLVPVVFFTLCIDKSVQRRSEASILFALYSNLHSSLFSLFHQHRCRFSFSISGATAWTDDQIRLIASICMFLLVFGKRNAFSPQQ